MRALNTTVHVESRSRRCSVRNISATPASPVCVATSMCSMYLDLGAASCPDHDISMVILQNQQQRHIELTLILVAPFTDFSNL